MLMQCCDKKFELKLLSLDYEKIYARMGMKILSVIFSFLWKKKLVRKNLMKIHEIYVAGTLAKKIENSILKVAENTLKNHKRNLNFFTTIKIFSLIKKFNFISKKTLNLLNP